MKNFLNMALIAIALLAVSATATAEKKDKKAAFACGTAYSVGPEDGSLLIQHHGKFALVTVGSGAAIRDGKGRSLTLEDIRPGDWIEYWSEAGNPANPKVFVNVQTHADCSSSPLLGKNG